MISSRILSPVMLVRVNGVDSMKSRVKVTQLDIDDFGSVIPLKELELNVSADDESTDEEQLRRPVLQRLPEVEK